MMASVLAVDNIAVTVLTCRKNKLTHLIANEISEKRFAIFFMDQVLPLPPWLEPWDTFLKERGSIPDIVEFCLGSCVSLQQNGQLVVLTHKVQFHDGQCACSGQHSRKNKLTHLLGWLVGLVYDDDDDDEDDDDDDDDPCGNAVKTQEDTDARIALYTAGHPDDSVLKCLHLFLDPRPEISASYSCVPRSVVVRKESIEFAMTEQGLEFEFTT
ncbi:hypothetical protein EGW08_001303 [Elysia chlorotica]|uniref:Uncharacterized protein n=1 Tax=Elysia chlorotica TaxID=188477 RepID=A0A433UAU3_ELYCH|nr:hypothetical protein EGW08_001303 [Elysia chlorotica]